MSPNIIAVAVLAVLVVLYMLKRRSRLKSEQD